MERRILNLYDEFIFAAVAFKRTDSGVATSLDLYTPIFAVAAAMA
jgi:hypothetical protein